MTRTNVRILVSSAGRRAGLIECFRSAADDLGLDLEVYACDMQPQLSAACQLADRAFEVPHCATPWFADAVCDIVRAHGVDLVVPTIDPELRPLAERAASFESLGARVHVSSPAVVDIVRDKLETARVLGAAGLPVPRTAEIAEVRDDPDRWAWPLFMKPRGGSASRSLSIVPHPSEIPERVDEPMVLQELLTGPEYTVNLFIDQQGTLRSIVPHLRIQVRAGEVEKGRTERNTVLADLARGIAGALPAARGALCFQVMMDPERGARIIEINARFGGGYPLAHRAGATFTRWLLEEVSGLPVSAHDNWREGLLMLRYDAAVFQE
jgi:carbamoyl-phosphate synthase large subunit